MSACVHACVCMCAPSQIEVSENQKQLSFTKLNLKEVMNYSLISCTSYESWFILFDTVKLRNHTSILDIVRQLGGGGGFKYIL